MSGDDHGRVEPCAVEQVHEVEVDGQHRDVLALEHFAELGCGETRVEVDDAESGLGCGDGQLDEVAVVATGDAQAVAALCADAVQALREPS